MSGTTSFFFTSHFPLSVKAPFLRPCLRTTSGNIAADPMTDLGALSWKWQCEAGEGGLAAAFACVLQGAECVLEVERSDVEQRLSGAALHHFVA